MDFNEIAEFLDNLSAYEQQFLVFFVASCILWFIWLLSNDKYPQDTDRPPFFVFFCAAYCVIILCTLPVAIPCLILGALIYSPIKELVERNIKGSNEYATGKDLLAAQKERDELSKTIVELESRKVQYEKDLDSSIENVDNAAKERATELERRIADLETKKVQAEANLTSRLASIDSRYNARLTEIDKQIRDMERKKDQLEQDILERQARFAFLRNTESRKLHNDFLAQKQSLQLQSKQLQSLAEAVRSNLTALPYMAKIVADFDTRNLEILARQLEWGDNQERRKKVRSLRELRKATADMIAQYKEAEYKLAYAIAMFPGLEDFLDADSQDIPKLNLSDLEDDGGHDRVLNYLSTEEYRQLPSAERNQLALDRYRASHRKTNWQIGRDYEMYVGYKYEQKGYRVDYHGVRKGLEDLGRDLIAVGKGQTLIIQCKYWSSSKVIHEKHITQLYGTMVCYCYENGLPRDQVLGVLVTNIKISDTARKFADYLGIGIAEEFPFGEYPCIKCNINRSAEGGVTRIYHLPFDQQYDSCVINAPGEFMAMTTAEAEAAGFRRAYRWHNQ